jgi:GR25 family glycosyltransferase involved in LPS biosynthesis
MTLRPPAFIAFTGVDRAELKDGLTALSERYPIEWGVLIDDTQVGNPLFPDASVRAKLLSGEPLRWAAHICGAQARAIVEQPQTTTMNLAGFQRAQINHSFTGSNPTQIGNSCLFGRRHGVRTVLQCSASFPADARVDWLFDTSFGRGSAPSAWPRLPLEPAFCGLSGGLNQHNVRDVLEQVASPADAVYWIDMESGVRTDGWFDLAKCEAVCRAVYG